MTDIPAHFTGKELTITGKLSIGGVDLPGRDTIWLFDISLDSLDQLILPVAETKDSKDEPTKTEDPPPEPHGVARSPDWSKIYKMEESKAIDHRNARSVVEAYVASALVGDVAKAASLAKNAPADPNRTRELQQLLNVQRLKIETVYINDPAKPTQALATSEAVKLEEEQKNPDGRRDGFMVFTLELIDEKWFVIDIDFKAESGAEKELKKFLKANPNSIGIPPQSQNLSR